MKSSEKLSLKQVQEVSLEILRFVHRFCEDNGIAYSLSYGTLLGAIRHQGFIPWDDDIDIMMPRPDFERFCKCFSSPDYTLVCYQDSDSRDVLCRVCDMRSTVVDGKVCFCDRNVGVWIEIFVLDSVSEDPSDFRRQVSAISRNIPYRHLHTFRHFFTSRQAALMKKHLWGTTGYWSQMGICRSGKMPVRYPDELISGYELRSFEGSEFHVIKGYDVFLRLCYGDYMKPVPEEMRISRHMERFTYRWREPRPLTVLTSGTFDLLHFGHTNLLKNAKALGDRLIVMVASDKACFHNGKFDIIDNEETRKENVVKTGIADEVIITGKISDFLKTIRKYKVDIFALGSDLTGNSNWARPYCRIVYLPRTKGISSSILRQRMKK